MFKEDLAGTPGLGGHLGSVLSLSSLPIQCEETKATVQKCVQTPRHSKETLNRLNQAIQQLKMEAGGTRSQVRPWGWGWGGVQLPVTPL